VRDVAKPAAAAIAALVEATSEGTDFAGIDVKNDRTVDRTVEGLPGTGLFRKRCNPGYMTWRRHAAASGVRGQLAGARIPLWPRCCNKVLRASWAS
jgi:hypothetical protein